MYIPRQRSLRLQGCPMRQLAHLFSELQRRCQLHKDAGLPWPKAQGNNMWQLHKGSEPGISYKLHDSCMTHTQTNTHHVPSTMYLQHGRFTAETCWDTFWSSGCEAPRSPPNAGLPQAMMPPQNQCWANCEASKILLQNVYEFYDHTNSNYLRSTPDVNAAFKGSTWSSVVLQFSSSWRPLQVPPSLFSATKASWLPRINVTSWSLQKLSVFIILPAVQHPACSCNPTSIWVPLHSLAMMIKVSTSEYTQKITKVPHMHIAWHDDFLAKQSCCGTDN